MKFSIEARQGYLRVLVYDRDTAEDVRKVVLAMHAACEAHDMPKVLVCVRRSRAIFKPEDYGLQRLKPLILYGASPRASLSLTRAARARAFLAGRGFVTPQDVKAVGYGVMRHRVLTTYEAEAEGVGSEDVLRQVFDTVPVP